MDPTSESSFNRFNLIKISLEQQTEFCCYIFDKCHAQTKEIEDFDHWFEHFVSGVGGEGASSKRWRVWGSETGWPTMSASMRSTLQTVPESVPADHVTNSKVSTKTWGTPSPLRSCDRNCSFEDETAGRVLQKIVPVLCGNAPYRIAISYVHISTIFCFFHLFSRWKEKGIAQEQTR